MGTVFPRHTIKRAPALRIQQKVLQPPALLCALKTRRCCGQLPLKCTGRDHSRHEQSIKNSFWFWFTKTPPLTPIWVNGKDFMSLGAGRKLVASPASSCSPGSHFQHRLEPTWHKTGSCRDPPSSSGIRSSLN